MRLHHMMIWHNIILKTNYDFQSYDYMMTFYHMMTFHHMMIFHHMMNMHHNIKTCACSSKGLVQVGGCAEVFRNFHNVNKYYGSPSKDLK